MQLSAPVSLQARVSVFYLRFKSICSMNMRLTSNKKALNRYYFATETEDVLLFVITQTSTSVQQLGSKAR